MEMSETGKFIPILLTFFFLAAQIIYLRLNRKISDLEWKIEKKIHNVESETEKKIYKIEKDLAALELKNRYSSEKR
jgi:hypothetical protein